MIPSEGIDGLPSSCHQKIIKLARVSQTKFIELMWEGEHQMVVMGIDKLLLSLLDPLFFLSVLATRTVSVAATVVAIVELIAGVTTIEVSTQSRRTASPDGIKNTQLEGVAVLLNKRPLLVDDTSNDVGGSQDLV